MKLAMTWEKGVYAAALGVGLGLRLALLGQTAFTENEAALALQAWDLARGVPTVMGPQPGYLLLTLVNFFLGGANEFLARLWPALAGSLLVLAPWFLRERLGRVPAVILAFALAVDPALLALSRTAEGGIFSVSLGLLALALLAAGKPAPAGVLAGLALLGGPAAWLGLLVGALVWLWSRWGHRKTDTPAEAWPWRTFLPWLGVGLVGFGTLFMLRPMGLSAWVNSFLVFWRGWHFGGGSPLNQMVLALGLMEALPLMLGWVGLLHGWQRKDALDGLLGRWFAAALVIVLIYPARQVTDWVWVTVPLWALAAREVCRLFEGEDEHGLISIGQAVLGFTLMGFAWLNVVGLNLVQEPEVTVPGGLTSLSPTTLRTLSIVISFVLFVVISIMIGVGWSRRAGLRGFVGALLAAMLVWTGSAAWHSAGLSKHPETNLWLSSPLITDGDLIRGTLGDLAEWNVRSRSGIEIVVEDNASPSLRWLLRDFTQVRYVNALAVDGTPAVVFTRSSQPLSLPAAYTGQDFVLQSSSPWSLLYGDEWVRWLITREAPTQQEALFLWARSDLFAGGQGTGPVMEMPEDSGPVLGPQEAAP
ncbi:hypothetical protein ADN01_00740 [Levilinea saccharolytica]|uniref:Glycosyltransferase RgtA/B/C/D-like domain-containing protein n=2 Tax=Levilinea saccharolytica TaxID=229921 RepID=A0A0P6Y2C7_9CHLR|nr:hypothetical protein ADN01_00740 [Levilinea saccharolytica]GAP17662.1 hypothetical protein LSAC_01537 [Levilinea saccharolytica]